MKGVWFCLLTEQGGASYLVISISAGQGLPPTAMTNRYQFAQDHPRLKSAPQEPLKPRRTEAGSHSPSCKLWPNFHKDIENDDQMK